jgi:6-phosphofructokinase 2
VRAVVTITLNPTIDMATSVGRLTPVRKLRCTAARRAPGGGGINVARVILKLGGNVTAIFPMGGATGQLLRHMVDTSGIRSIAFPTADESRVSFTVVENETGDEYRFVLPGPSLSDSEWRQCMQELSGLPNKPDTLVMSGSLPPGVPDDFYARIARVAKEWDARLVLDTSGPALAAALTEKLFLIKPNLRELRELTGQPLEDEKSWLVACRALIETGNVAVVALTLGGQGALLITDHAALRATAPPIKAVSAVGAGDSFLGAMVWALSIGLELEEAFRYGVAAGSAALIAPGAELCCREDIDRLLPQVTTRSM